MGISTQVDELGVAEIVVDCPPVNALTVAGWFELADAVTSAGRDPATRVVVLRAEGKGFNAGVDIKEMQHTTGFDALIGANKGCYAAFAAVYECAVPVVVAVNGFCVGGGIGLVATQTSSSRVRMPTSACRRWIAARWVRPPTCLGLCRSTRCERWSTPQPPQRRPNCTTSAAFIRWCHAPNFVTQPWRSHTRSRRSRRR